MKENSAFTRKKGMTLSLSKQHKEKQKNSVSEEKLKKYEGSMMPNIHRMTPPKRARNSQQIFPQLSEQHQNNQRRPTMGIIKPPLKLRLSCQQELREIQSILSVHENTQSFTSLNDIISNGIIKQLISKKFIMKNLSNHYIISQQIMVGLLEKFFYSVLCIKTTKTIQSLGFLDIIMESIQKIAKIQNSSNKILKNKISQQIIAISVSGSISEYLAESRANINQLKDEKEFLLNKIEELAIQKSCLRQENVRVKKEIENLTKNIGEHSNLLEQLTLQINTKSKELNQISELLSISQKDYMEILDYVEKETKNMHVKNASKYYKEIEASIYEYASYLQSNQLATSLTYESIPLQNQHFILEGLEEQLKDVNTNILSDESTLEEKGKIMRDFVMKVMTQHKRKDVQYEKAIEFKTRSICKFVEMMKKWLDNWTLKQEYLVGLRKQFAVDSRVFLEHFEALYKEKMCSACKTNNFDEFNQIGDTFLKLKENYKMGNSFY